MMAKRKAKCDVCKQWKCGVRSDRLKNPHVTAVVMLCLKCSRMLERTAAEARHPLT